MKKNNNENGITLTMLVITIFDGIDDYVTGVLNSKGDITYLFYKL